MARGIAAQYMRQRPFPRYLQSLWRSASLLLPLIAPCALAGCTPGATIVETNPPDGATNVPANTNISVEFSTAMDPEAVVNTANFVVRGSVSGVKTTTATYTDETRLLVIDPASDFAQGEVVTVTLTTAITSSIDVPIDSESFSFTISGVALTGGGGPGIGEFEVASTNPSANASGANTRPTISIDFSREALTPTVTMNLHVYGEVSGARLVDLNPFATDVTTSFAPGSAEGLTPRVAFGLSSGAASFVPGERVSISLTDGIQGQPSQEDLAAIAEHPGAIDPAATGLLTLQPTVFNFEVRNGIVDVLGHAIGELPPLSQTTVFSDVAGVVFGDFRPVSAGLEAAIAEKSGAVSVFRRVNEAFRIVGEPVQLLGTPVALRQADLDADRRPDLVVLTDNMVDLKIMELLGEVLQVKETIAAEQLGVSAPIDMEIADLDGDGLLDIAIGHGGGLRVLRLVDAALLSFEPLNIPVPGSVSVAGALELGDIDEDGAIDIAIVSGSGQVLSLLRNLGDMSFQSVSQLGSDHQGLVRIADLEGDGDLDVVTGAAAGGLRFFENPGQIPSPEWSGSAFEAGEAIDDVRVANIDGDQGGLRDLVTIGNGNLKFWVRGSQGLSGSEVETLSLPSPVGAARLGLADANDDGGLDAVVYGTGNILLAATTGVIDVGGADFSFAVPAIVSGDSADPTFDVPVSASTSAPISAFSVVVAYDATALELVEIVPDAATFGAEGVATLSVYPQLPDGQLGYGIAEVELSDVLAQGTDITLLHYVFRQTPPDLGTFSYSLLNNKTNAQNATIRNQVTVASSAVAVDVDISTDGNGVLDVTSSVPGISDLTCVPVLEPAENPEDDPVEHIELAWTNNAAYSRVEIRRNGQLLSSLEAAPVVPSSYVDFFPTNGTATYEATGFLGLSPSAAESCTVTLVQAPQNFTCERVGSTVQLAWQTTTTYTSFILRRDGNVIQTLGGSQLAAVDTSADLNGHFYELTGVQGNGQSAAVGCVLPDGAPFVTAAPTNVTATVQAFNDVLVAWVNQESYDAQNGIEVARSGPGGTVEFLLAGTATTLLDEDLSPGGYTYTVTGSVAGVSSQPAASQAPAQVLLPPPTGLACTVPGGNDVALAWTNGFEYDSIEVVRTFEAVAATTVLAGDATSFQDFDLANGTYVYQVIGRYDDGSVQGIASISNPTCTVVIRSELRVEDLSTAPGRASDLFISAQLVDTLVALRFVLEYDGNQFVIDQTTIGTDSEGNPIQRPFVEFPFALGTVPDGAVTDTAVSETSTRRRLTVDVAESAGVTIPAGGDALIAVVHGSTPKAFDRVGATPLDFITETGSVASPAFTYSGEASQPLASAEVFDGTLKVFGDLMYMEEIVAEAGDTIEVPVFGTYDQTLTAYTAVISYDPDVLTCVEISNEGTVGEEIGFVFPTFDNDDGVALGFVAAVSGTIPADFDQALVYFIFEVNADAAIGSVSPIDFGVHTSAGGTETESTLFGPNLVAVRVGNNIGDLLVIGGSVVIGGVAGPSTPACSQLAEGIAISWTNGDPYDAIHIERDGIVVAVLAGSVTNYVDLDPLLPGTHSYRVIAVVGGLELASPASCTLEVEPPVIPAVLLGCELVGANAVLTWTLPSGATYDSFRIERDGVEIASGLAGTTTAYTDTATPSGSNFYEVIGMQGAFASPSAFCTVIKVPAAPTGVACSVDDNDVNVTWTNADAYTSLDVLRDGVVVNAVPIAGTAQSFTELGVPVGTYAYTVRGRVDTVFSPLSAACTAVVVSVPTAPVSSLVCAQIGTDVDLSWVNGQVYDFFPGIQIYRDGILHQSLAGAATSYVDAAPPLGEHTYEVYGVSGGDASQAAACTVDVVEDAVLPQFIRGDLDGNGVVGITDSITLLDYLFSAVPVICADAGDIDDDGRVLLNDSILLLNHLYSGGPPPLAPYPGCGPDLTADENDVDLGCEGPVPGCPLP